MTNLPLESNDNDGRTAVSTRINNSHSDNKSNKNNTAAEKSLSLLRTLSNDHLDRKRRNLLSTYKSNRHTKSFAYTHTPEYTSAYTSATDSTNLASLSALASSTTENKPKSSFFGLHLPNPLNIMGNKNSQNRGYEEEYYYGDGDDYYYDPEHNYNSKQSNSYSKKSNSRSFRRGKQQQQQQYEQQQRHHKQIQKQKSTKSVDDLIYNDTAQEYYTLDELVDQEIYIVKQRMGYFSIAISVIQTAILATMMIMCSIAPLNINPMVGPYPDALDYWGAKNAAKIMQNAEWWRLVTPIFLHGGVIHLLCNISVQVDIGAFFEREWGSFIWLIIYFTSGIGSSIFSCVFNPDSISVGSSGAVMGLFGGKLGEIFCRACESTKTQQSKVAKEVRMEQLSQSLCSVILVLAFSFVPYVDWAAHLGGVICGFASGMVCFSAWIKTKTYAAFWFVVGVALNLVFYIVTLTYFLTYVEPRNDLMDVCEYYKQFFENYECNCQIDN